jgi:hypothetical protein
MGFVDGKNPGKLDMSGKVKLGVPKSKVSSKGNSSLLDKADNRGKNERIIKRG